MKFTSFLVLLIQFLFINSFYKLVERHRFLRVFEPFKKPNHRKLPLIIEIIIKREMSYIHLKERSKLIKKINSIISLNT